MKYPVVACSLCICLLAPSGSAQMMTGSHSIQGKGGSLMMSPDGKSYTGTATFGPPVMSPINIPGAERI
jgi:hypothetical protein